MSGKTYIEDLLEQVQRDAAVKSAADEDKSDEKDEDERSDEKDESEDDGKGKKNLPPWLKGKEASEDPFADLPEHVKAACAARAFTRLEASRAERALIFGYDTKQAAELPEAVEREIFNNAYFDHLDKLASMDPEFAVVLYQDEIKAAFNQGYADVAGQ